MRILFVVHQFLPRHAAGTEIYTYHLARGLAARGHDAHLFFTELRPEREQYELTRGEYGGLSYHEAVHNHAFASFRHTYRDERMEELFARVLDEVRPDVCHLQHLHLHSIGYVDMLDARGIPIVYTLHEYMLMCLRGGQLVRPGLELCEGPEAAACARCATIWPLPDAQEEARCAGGARERPAGLLRRLGAQLGSLLFGGDGSATAVAEPPGDPYLPAVVRRRAEIAARLAKVDLFVSPSAFLRERFVEHGMIAAERIIHSDNGFFVAPFEGIERAPRPAPKPFRVGYVGTIAEYKGVHLIVDAFAGIDDPDVQCVIWGDLGTFPDYEERLLGMEQPANLRFAGRFDNARIAEVLADIDLLVVPSVWFENSPLTIHEAFLARVPVLTADRGGMAELVTDGRDGLHFRMGDAADLRAQVLRAAREPGLYESLCRSFPHVKTIAEDTADTERRYRALLDARARRSG